jgi:hypothetical protein
MTEAFIYAIPFALAVLAAWDYARRVTALKRDQFQASADLAKGGVADLCSSVAGLSAQCAALEERVGSCAQGLERAWESLEGAGKRLSELEKNQVELARRLDGSPKISRFQRGG